MRSYNYIFIQFMSLGSIKPLEKGLQLLKEYKYFAKAKAMFLLINLTVLIFKIKRATTSPEK